MNNCTTERRRVGVTALVLLSCLLAAPARAAEIQSLAWESGTDKPVLLIKVSGDAAFTTQSLEFGQRLRVTFSGSTVADAVAELGGQGSVKGVYPYLAESGGAVNVDLLLAEAGEIQVEKVADGFRVSVQAGAVKTENAQPQTQTQAAEPVPAAPVTTPEPPPVAAAPVALPVAPVEEKAAEPKAPEAPKNAIEEIRYAKLPGDRIQITLRMAGAPPEPSSFTITNPPRISFDFANMAVSAKKRSVPIKEGALTGITAVDSGNRTRVVLSMVKIVGYTTAVDGNNFVITVDSPTVALATGQEAKKTHFAGSQKAVGRHAIKNIDFRRGPLGDGKIVVTLSEPTIGIDIREQSGEIIVDFMNSSLPPEFQRRLDVIDFATPVQTVDTYGQGRNVRMVILPKGKYEQVAYQAGNVFTVSVKPVVEKTGDKKTDEFGYKGEKLSLNFQNIDVRAALQVLADFTGLNFVVSDSVKGNLTLRLKDVPWDQALDIIVNAKDLAVRYRGNVVIVGPAAEVAAREKAAFEASKAALELEPLASELIQINYAKADEVATLLKSIKPVVTAGGQHPVFGASATGSGVQTATESNSLLSPRGQVSVDKRSNSLLVQDTPGKIREIRKLISELDRPIRQVMVETRLVEATDNFAKNLGSRLGHYRINDQGGTTYVSSGKLEQLPKLFPSSGTGVYEVSPAGLSVNLAAQGVGSYSAGSLMLAIMRGSSVVDMEISALEQAQQGKVISSPRVITGNQQKATIEQGQERVFTTSVLGVGSVVTKKATLKLDVTPQITPDDRVNLTVDITKDSFADATTGLLNVKQVTTQVLLDNGDTVVIGGIYEQEKQKTMTKIPFFGDLPLLGWLFRNKAEFDNKTELLIFLTPRILSEKLSIR
jgi:type IV pilus assembly protein PilQ